MILILLLNDENPSPRDLESLYDDFQAGWQFAWRDWMVIWNFNNFYGTNIIYTEQWYYNTYSHFGRSFLATDK